MKSIFIALFFLISFNAISQDKKGDNKTKMDNFTSRTGVITKLVDYKLDRLKSLYGNHQCRVRKIISNPISVFFFKS